jgi:hypothetical protein
VSRLKKEISVKKVLIGLAIALFVAVSFGYAVKDDSQKLKTATTTSEGFAMEVINGDMFYVVVKGEMKVVDIGLDGWNEVQTTLAQKMLSMRTVKLVNYTIDGNGFIRPEKVMVGNKDAVVAIVALNPKN